jgi:flagellar FliL protein
MALAEDAPAALPAPEGEPRKGGLLKFAAAMLAMTVAAAALGIGLGIKLVGEVEDAVRAKESAEAEKPAELLRYTGPAHMKQLAPVVTNLAEPRDTWIRLEASIVFEDEAVATDDVLAGRIAEDFLAYFRTISLAQVDGPSGMQHLREDLTDRARIRSDGRVSEVVVQTLVFQ